MKLWESKVDAPAGGRGLLTVARRSWLAGVALTTAIFLAPVIARAADSSVALEYKIKAGYLFNFARFVEWPAAVVPATDSPIVIGVLDGTEALPLIQQVLRGKTVNERPLIVKAITSVRSDFDCHILFVCRTASQSPAEVRDALGSAATLLVGETENFAEKGGMIEFVREQESFRIQLNLEAATRAGLKISAKLSNVARIVKTKKDK